MKQNETMMSIEERVEMHSNDTPGGLTADKKRILRAYYLREEIANNADYIPGFDDGEPRREYSK